MEQMQEFLSKGYNDLIDQLQPFFVSHHKDIHDKLDRIEEKVNNICVILDSQIEKAEDDD